MENKTIVGNNPKVLSNLRHSCQAIVISILEGKGTSDNPYEECRYVILDSGEVLGRIETDWKTRKIVAPTQGLASLGNSLL